MSVRRLSVTAVCLAFLTSCGTLTATSGSAPPAPGVVTTSSPVSDESEATSSTAASRRATTRRTTSRATRTATTTASAATCASLEGCYSKQQIQRFYDDAIGFVTQYSRSIYGSNVPDPRYEFIRSGEAVGSACGASDDTEYAYCPPDRSVYVGQEQLWEFYSDAGDAGAAAGIAHEWGHHLQNLAGVDGPTLIREQQADCVAGAWLAYMGTIGALEQGDIGDVERLIRFIASAETPDRDHGTLTERTAAFGYGYEKGLVGCNEYFPATPLLVSR